MTIIFLAIWLVDAAGLSSDSHWLPSYYNIFSKWRLTVWTTISGNLGTIQMHATNDKIYEKYLRFNLFTCLYFTKTKKTLFLILSVTSYTIDDFPHIHLCTAELILKEIRFFPFRHCEITIETHRFLVYDVCIYRKLCQINEYKWCNITLRRVKPCFNISNCLYLLWRSSFSHIHTQLYNINILYKYRIIYYINIIYIII